MNYVRFLLGKYLPQQNSFWKLSILTSISILLFTTPVFSNVYKLNNGSFLRGDLLKQDTSSITLRLREIRMPAWLYNAAMYKYQLDRQKMQKIRKIPVRGIIALKGDPILKPEVTIPKVQIQKTLKSETMWLMRVHEKNTERVDVFSFDERNLTYYDLGASSANPLAPDTPYKDILVSIPVKQIEALYALRNGKKEKIYPEPWYSFLTKPTLQDWDPRAGLIYSPFVPVGAIRQIDFGAIGGGLYGSINLPIRKAFSFMRRWHLRARTGLYLGYNQFSIETQYANSNIQLFPIMWIISIYYDFRKINGFYFSPSFKWNQGIIFSTVHKELKPEWRSKLKSGSPIIDGAYNGYASQLSLGLEVKHRSQRRLAYFLDLGYLVHAEDLSGTFFTMNLGVAWHFASSAPRAVVMPVLPTKPGVTFVPLELSGKTTSLSGEVVGNAKMRILDKESGSEINTLESDAYGNYKAVLQPGLIYVIKVRKTGYAESQMEFDLRQNQVKKQKTDFKMASLNFRLKNVNFQPGSAVLLPSSYPELDKLVNFLKENPDIHIIIEGHTDSLGNPQVNNTLSQKRAEAVTRYLTQKGIEASRMEAKGYGSSKPIADNSTEMGRRQNRRVEVKIKKENE